MTYFNLKTVHGVETVYSLDPKDFHNLKEYDKEVKRLKNEYYIAGMSVYTSQRSSKEFNN